VIYLGMERLRRRLAQQGPRPAPQAAE
jgi:hypothetical protein